MPRPVLRDCVCCSEHNYLVRLMTLVEQTLATCNKNCMACGDPLVYVGLKPTVCSKDVCKYGFEDLGAGFDLSGEIAEQPQVVDLLITCTVTAVAANRMVCSSAGGGIGSGARSSRWLAAHSATRFARLLRSTSLRRRT